MGLLLNVAATGGLPARAAKPKLQRHRREAAMPKIVIAAGGTAGHVVPALAVADALRDSGAEVEFVGGERAEAELVPAAGFPFHRLKVRGHRPPQPAAGGPGRAAGGGARPARAPAAAAQLGADAVHGRRRLRGRRRSGWPRARCGLPLVLTEADSHLGITNRLLARFARRVFLAFPIEGRDGRALQRGRAAGARRAPAAPTATRRAARFGIGPDETCLLVFGGSLGARRLNEAALERLRRGRARVRCCTPAGRRDHDELAARLAALGSPPHYHLHAYVEPFADALAAADLVVARVGRLGARGGRGGAAVDPGALPARHGRPPDRQRPPHGGAGRRRGGARRRARRAAAGARGGRAAGRARADGGHGRAAAAVAKPDAARVIADEVLALAAIHGRA